MAGMNFESQKLKSRLARINKLKKNMLFSPPEILPYRDELVFQAYRVTENEPAIIRRARVLENILTNMPITIFEEELIVGNLAGPKQRGVGLFLEFSSKWKERELDRFEKRQSDRFIISTPTKERFRRLFCYWRGKTVNERAMALMPLETKKSLDSKVFFVDLHLFSGLGHVALDFRRVLNQGFEGIKREVAQEMNKLDLSNPEDLKKLAFFKGLTIVCDAASNFGKRFAQEARRLKDAEKNLPRKKELEIIAQACEQVPEKPARTFHEALQTVFFVQLITQIESDGTAVSPGRFDQYTYPFYRRDIDAKRITKDEALELIECLWIKLNQILKVWSEEDAKNFGGFPISQNLNAGGQSPDGQDATNEVSYLCLRALEELRLPQPAFSVRIHDNTSEQFSWRVAEVAKLGTGMPAIFNDEVIIPAMLNRGISLEDARDYALVGCVEPSVHGKDWPRCNGGFFNLAKVLEVALNSGKCGITGRQLGLPTGDASTFTSFNELMATYKKQLAYFIKHIVIANNVIDVAHAELAPLPFVSSLTHDCIEKGEDVTAGGAHYNTTAPLGVGLANAADSLAAIKKLVYEEQTLKMSELSEGLASDFKGNEPLRQTLLNKVPKYGNDDDYVDKLAREIAAFYCKELNRYWTMRGTRFQGAFIPVSSNVPLGATTSATPDGRRARESLAEGISPAQGKDKKGPTAVVKSVAKIDHTLAPLGTLLNLKFSPRVLEGEKGTQALSQLIRTFFTLGGMHVQFNVVDAKILREAQREPEKHRNLVVRVAGYSAFFVDLDKKIQDDIINRTEHLSI